jgi:hypothetical protein
MARLGESLTINLTRAMAGSKGVRWLRRGKWQGAGGHPRGRRGWGGTRPVWPPRGAKGPWLDSPGPLHLGLYSQEVYTWAFLGSTL